MSYKIKGNKQPEGKYFWCTASLFNGMFLKPLLYGNSHYLLTPTKTYFQKNKKEDWRQINTIMTPQSPFTLLVWKKIHRKSIVTEAVRP